ncbi:hypothetical protein EON79_06105 [bacterium]|nr:MAG: hypothetical protein EON79_06105 [bacterium]
MKGRTLTEILEELEGVLPEPHRALIADLRATEDPFDFGDKAQSMEIWGGIGSVIDLDLPDPLQDRRLNELIVELEDALADLNLSSPRMAQVARLIEDWLIAHPGP